MSIYLINPTFTKPFEIEFLDLIDYGDGNGYTPLMHAVCASNIECLKLLLDSGSKPESRDRIGRTALILCALSVSIYWRSKANPDALWSQDRRSFDIRYENCLLPSFYWFGVHSMQNEFGQLLVITDLAYIWYVEAERIELPSRLTPLKYRIIISPAN